MQNITKTNVLSIRLTPNDRRNLDRLARHMRRSKSDALRIIIADAARTVKPLKAEAVQA